MTKADARMCSIYQQATPVGDIYALRYTAVAAARMHIKSGSAPPMLCGRKTPRRNTKAIITGQSGWNCERKRCAHATSLAMGKKNVANTQLLLYVCFILCNTILYTVEHFEHNSYVATVSIYTAHRTKDFRTQLCNSEETKRWHR